MNTRLDLYTPIHKAIRSILFSTTTAFARADFSDEASGRAACKGVRRLVEALRDHGHHEDQHVMPLLATCDPTVAAILARDHTSVEALHAELVALAALAEEAAPAARLAAVPALASVLHRLVASHLQHMDRGETEANAALWAHTTDGQLAAVHRSIMASIPPEPLMETLAVMIPALNPSERAALVAGVAATAPPAAAARVQALADQAARAV
jgi:hypothetical protein